MKKFKASTKNVRFSPYKLRPLVDVIRNKNADYALGWLSTMRLKRSKPIAKLVHSAVANATQQSGLKAHELRIADIRVDEGPMYKYFRPGAMGRAEVLRRRLSHMSVVLEGKEPETSSKH